eukprot:scaffold37907_cov20-Tisochrysis_lutea.AAC.1
MTQDPTERPSFTAILDCMDKAYHGSGVGSMPNANGSGPQHQAQGEHAACQAPRLKLIEAGAASSDGGEQQREGGVHKGGMPEAAAQGGPDVVAGSCIQGPGQHQPHIAHGSPHPASSSKTPRQNEGNWMKEQQP